MCSGVNQRKPCRNSNQTSLHPLFRDNVIWQLRDCRSFFDQINRTASPSCSEFRISFVARAIREAIKEGIQVCWVHSGARLADALPKSMETSFLWETLQMGVYRLCDEDALLKERAKSKTGSNGCINPNSRRTEYQET